VKYANFTQVNKRAMISGPFVRSFRSFLRGGIRPLAVFRRAFSLPPVLRPMRPRLVVKRSLGLAKCASPLTLGLVLHIYRAQLGRRVSLAGANMLSSIRPLAICCPHRLLSPHSDALNPGVMSSGIIWPQRKGCYSNFPQFAAKIR